jgi:ABC-2 type transport system permease protein
LYVTGIIYAALIMIPAFIVYVRNVDVNFLFYILFFITLLVIPMIPLVVSSIIGSLITAISSRFKHKNIINYILTIGLFVVIMVYSASLENMKAIDMANIGKSMIDMFNGIYPLVSMYNNILSNSNILSLILFIALPIILFMVYIKLMVIFYSKINDGLSSYKKNKKYKIGVLKRNTPLLALYKKELKRYFSSVIYVTNTAMGAIMLTLSVIGIVIAGGDKINQILGMPGFSTAISSIGPLIMGAFCMLNCSTHSSISLEGKNLWIIKSLPVDTKKIFYSKIMVNLTILVPAILINSTIFCIYLKTNLIMTLYMFITPLIYSLFISIIGLIINLHFPIFNWKNEIKVIKQSMSSFIAIFVGMGIAIIPFTIKYSMSNELFTTIVTSAVLLITIASYLYMNSYGIKIFNKLSTFA